MPKITLNLWFQGTEEEAEEAAEALRALILRSSKKGRLFAVTIPKNVDEEGDEAA